MKKFQFIVLSLFLLNIVSFGLSQEKKLPRIERDKKRIIKRDFERETLTPELEQKILDIIANTEPEEIQHLKKLKETSPLEYEEILLNHWEEFKFLKRLKEENPEEFELIKKRQELERNSRKMVRMFRKSADENEKDKIKKDLTVVLYQLFDIRESEKEAEIFRLEKELEKMKKIVQQRKENKETIVESHLNRLLGAEEYLEW